MKASVWTSFLVLWLLLQTTMPAPAQSNDHVAHDRLVGQIKDFYNAADYAGIHRLLSPAFQQEFAQPEVVTFFRDKIGIACGKMESASYVRTEEKTRVYEVQGEKSILTLSLVLNGRGQVSGMRFTPGKPAAKAKIAGRAAPGHDNPLKTELDQKVHQVVGEFFRQETVPGLTVGVISGSGRTVYNYGERVRGTGELPKETTLYETGSVSKTFTGLLLAQAVQEQKIRLDADIRTLLPGEHPNLEMKGEPVRLVQLANHTSGLPRLPQDFRKQPGYDPLRPYEHYDWPMMKAFLGVVQLESVPGTHESYSNFGVAVLGHFLEDALGGSYDELVRTRICQPWGMVDTRLEATDPSRLAQGYNDQGKETPRWDLRAWAPAGGLHSTMKDMLVFLGHHMHPQSEAVALALKKTWGQGREAVGLAWQITALKEGQTLFWHNGGTAGFSSFCGFIPGRDFGVVVLSNSGESVDGVATRLLRP